MLPPHLLELDYEHRKGMYAALDPFIIHWSVLFLILMLIGYFEYAFELNIFQESMTLLMVLTVVFSILSVPHMYGDITIPVEECIAQNSTGGSIKQGSATKPRITPQKNQLSQQYAPSDSDDEEISDRSGVKDGSGALADTVGRANSVSAYGSVMDGGSSETDSLLHNAELSTYPETCYYGDSLPLAESVKTWRLWALFFHYLVSTGVGLMVIYNVDAIAEAVDKEPSSFFVTLISLTNGLGRVFAGWMSDRLSITGLSKLQLLSVVVLSMAVVQLLLSFGWTAFLFPGFLLVGFLFGCNVSLTAINVADIFGEKFIATNFGFVDTSPIIGSYVYATMLVTIFYYNNATIDSTEPTCLGADCFRYPFLINAVSCILGGSLVLFLHYKTPRQ